MGKTNSSVRGTEAPQATCGDADECREVAATLSCIGDKWTVLVIGALSEGPLRYGQVRREVEGISQRMLTLTLKGLEQDGLVDRTMYPTIPPRVDYELTALGRKLTVPLLSLYKWAKKHGPDIEAARKRYAEKLRGPALQHASARSPHRPRRKV